MPTHLELEVAHSVLRVRDMERMIAFYTDVLGFEVVDRGPLGPDGAPEICFLSQAARHHHQVAFLEGESEGNPPSIHHVAYRATGTLADLRELKRQLEERGDIEGIMPLTHGNAWSVYFNDPEGNGVEIFIDTPWHVQQPQAVPLDLDRSDEEIEAWTVEVFGERPQFGDLEEFYAARAEHLARRNG